MPRKSQAPVQGHTARQKQSRPERWPASAQGSLLAPGCHLCRNGQAAQGFWAAPQGKAACRPPVSTATTLLSQSSSRISTRKRGLGKSSDVGGGWET